jgi:hypothetical protein
VSAVADGPLIVAVVPVLGYCTCRTGWVAWAPVTSMTAHALPVDVVPPPMSFSVRVIVPLPGDAPHWSIHAPERRVPGPVFHVRCPSGTHVPWVLVGTDRGALPVPIESVTKASSSEFAAGLIDAVV